MSKKPKIKTTASEIQQTQAALRSCTPTPHSLLIPKHLEYLYDTLHSLGKSIIHFDNAQPWVYYHIAHGIALLGGQLDSDEKNGIAKALGYCQSQQFGGFAGGYMQLPHLAPTYSACLTILTLGPQYYHLLHKKQLEKFFRSCKSKENTFTMHLHGEHDLRASYIVAIITKLLHLDETLLDGVADKILKSQTYEGGISNVIGGEAHGGFTYCGVAALAILGRLQDLDISRLMMWLSQRQADFGGFNGRTNKLLDSCYSFWVGAIHTIIQNYFSPPLPKSPQFLFSSSALHTYILEYCQQEFGGLRDKPGKNRDIYHTCYALSGYSATAGQGILPIDPIYNIHKEKYQQAKQHYDKEPFVTQIKPEQVPNEGKQE